MLQIHGTIDLKPSFHGSHRWKLNLTDQRSSSIEAEHVCSGVVQVAVDARALEEFVPSAEAIVVASREDSVGCDGMTCSFDLVVNGTLLRDSIWSIHPRVHGALWELVDGLWRLFYREGPECYRPYLEHVGPYFRAGLPLTWVSPTHARLYGRLSIHELEALDEALRRAPAGCTIDMSNLDGMGTKLYPLFRDADERIGARWIVNEAARRALTEAGVAPGKLIQTTEGPYRSGLRCEVLLTAFDAPVRVSVEVAALLHLNVRDARVRLQTLPLSLGHFDAEDVEELRDRLSAAGAEVLVR